MEKTILIVGSNRRATNWLGRNLQQSGDTCRVCGTMREMVEELNAAATGGFGVSLVVIYPDALQGCDADFVDDLSGCALEVPFVLMDGRERDRESWEGQSSERRAREVFRALCRDRAPFEPDEYAFTDFLRKRQRCSR